MSYNFSLTEPPTTPQVVDFIASLACQSLSSQTIGLYVTAVSFQAKISGLPDPTNSFLVRKLLQGVRKSMPSGPDIRFPVTKPILDKLVSALQFTTQSSYYRLMYTAMFTLCYYCLFRISEVVGNPPLTNHAIQFANILVQEDTLSIYLQSSKTDKFSEGCTIVTHARSGQYTCPVTAVKNYMAVRPSFPGQLFVNLNGKSTTRHDFTSVLQRTVEFCNLSPHIKSHSFRIGRASDLKKAGIDDNQIKERGRWSSSTFKHYIRN